MNIPEGSAPGLDLTTILVNSHRKNASTMFIHSNLSGQKIQCLITKILISGKVKMHLNQGKLKIQEQVQNRNFLATEPREQIQGRNSLLMLGSPGGYLGNFLKCRHLGTAPAN